MTMKYVRDRYGVPAKRGGKVRFKFEGEWVGGHILSATSHVFVAPDASPDIRLIFHPNDLVYL